MFEHQFFPTPDDIIREMLTPYFTKQYGTTWGLNGKYYFLEPSAGKGDILDWLDKNTSASKGSMACVEIDPDLREILFGKGYRVIDTDFLEYDGQEWFNFIIMNPPFADGVDHLLKAWDILPEGEIACVLNASNLRNTYSEKRQRLERIVEQHAPCPPKFMQGAFLEAEVRTDVEIVIIWLHKDPPQSEIPEFQLHEVDERVSDKDYRAIPLANSDMVDAVVAQYEASRKLIIEIHELEKKLAFYHVSVSRRGGEEILSGPTPGDLNGKLAHLKNTFWAYIFERLDRTGDMTSNFRTMFEKMQKMNSQLAFSRKNILDLVDFFMTNFNTILKECVSLVFDQATAYHKENKVWNEGWKTNSSYKVNRKMIIPWGIRYSKTTHRGYTWHDWRVSWDDQRFYEDIDKVLCILSGKRYKDIRATSKMFQMRVDELSKKDYGHDKKFYSEFFEIRIFKKQTVHLKFIDEDLWQRFNIAAAEGKGWVGPGY